MVGCFRSKEKCGGAGAEAARDAKNRRVAAPVNCVDRSTAGVFGMENRMLAIFCRCSPSSKWAAIARFSRLHASLTLFRDVMPC